MAIDPDDVFEEVERRRSAGQLLSDIDKKVDYEKQARYEVRKLKTSLGCAELSDEEFFKQYQKKTTHGQ